MSLGEEIVGIHGRGQHGCKGTGGFIRLDRRGKDHEVRFDVKLFIRDEVGRLDHQLISLGRHLADHSLDIVDAVFLNGAAVELVEILTGCTHVDIENVNVGVRVFIPREHRWLRRIHTAYLGAVFLALLGGGAS